MLKKFLLAIVTSLIIAYLPKATAIEIQELTTPSGIKIWLVESHALPFISTEATFRAGSSFDPSQRQGLSNLVASLINEGAGEMPSAEFNKQLERIGAKVWANSDKLNLSVNLKTLSKYKQEGFELFGKAITSPRFDDDAVERMKAGIIANIKRSKENPGSVAGELFSKTFFQAHPYANLIQGTEQSVADMGSANARFFHQNSFTKANMVISMVGDITPQEAIDLTEKALNNLPAGIKRNSINHAPDINNASLVRSEMPTPQSHVIMASRGISRHDPDYFAAYAMNYILGGGGFSSRLTEEVREKRGLAYSIYSYFNPLPHFGPFVVKFQTKNEDVETSIKLVKEQMHKIAEEGVSEDEYKAAMNYLTGSFPLRLDSNSKVLGYLTVMQMEGLGVDYLDIWTQKIQQVTQQDIKRVAKQLLKPEEMLTIIVGGGK